MNEIAAGMCSASQDPEQKDIFKDPSAEEKSIVQRIHEDVINKTQKRENSADLKLIQQLRDVKIKCEVWISFT